MIGYPKGIFITQHQIKCWCGVTNTLNSIRRWWNGQPMCECGAIIKNAPDSWKKAF